MIGDVNLFLTDPEDRTVAEIELMIADPGFRRLGLGREAALLMLRYGNPYSPPLKLYFDILKSL